MSKLPPEQRGLGADHRRQRDRLIKLLATKIAAGATVNCWWCGQPMHPEPARNPDGRPLEADHSKARATHGWRNNPADRLLHHRCNRQRGDGTRDHQRPAIAHQAPTDDPLGHRAMPWPQ